MEVEVGFELKPRHARALERRMALRRLVAAANHEGRHVRIDQLPDVERDVAMSFRPRLRPDVLREGRRLIRAPIKLKLDAFESHVVGHLDGQLPLGEVAILAANAVSDPPATPIEAAIGLIAELGRFDMILTGAQSVNAGDVE